MSEQTQKNRASSKDEESVSAEAKDLRDAELVDDVDAILTDIDDVLEENAEEFVQNYVQKGGE